MVRMSTGHMEGDLQPLYLLLTDCYIYLLRKGNCSHYTLQCMSFHDIFMHTLLAQLRTSSGWTAGAAEKPYTVEEAVSYNELDYLSVSPAHSNRK